MWTRCLCHANKMIEPGKVCLSLTWSNAIGMVSQEQVLPCAQGRMKFLHEWNNIICDGFSDEIQQQRNRGWPSSVPRQSEPLCPLNHRPVRLLNKQRTAHQSLEHHLRRLLASQQRNQTIPSIDERLMMIQHPSFVSVFNGSHPPNSMKRIVEHERGLCLGHHIVYGVQRHSVDVRLNQPMEKSINRGDRCFIKRRQEHFDIGI